MCRRRFGRDFRFSDASLRIIVWRRDWPEAAPTRHEEVQIRHVAHRLDQYGAGRRMVYQSSDPDRIAAAMVEELARPVAFRPAEADGAARAAAMLAELL